MSTRTLHQGRNLSPSPEKGGVAMAYETSLQVQSNFISHQLPKPSRVRALTIYLIGKALKRSPQLNNKLNLTVQWGLPMHSWFGMGREVLKENINFILINQSTSSPGSKCLDHHNWKRKQETEIFKTKRRVSRLWNQWASNAVHCFSPKKM